MILLGELFVSATIEAPGFLHPTNVGQDSSTYYAAGQRLNDGHNLYGPLLPGDRQIPRYPRVYRAPLLSPPLIAVIWRPLAVLGEASMVAWWAGALIIVLGLTIGFAAKGGRWTLGGLFVLLFMGLPFAILLSVPYSIPGLQSPITIAAISGNLNGYIVGLCIIVWWASSRQRPWIAGIAAGFAAVLKLGPFAIGWWLVVRRDWPAVKAFAATVGILGLVGLVGAGVHANLSYVRLLLVGHIRTTSLSVPWMLETWFHMSPGLAEPATDVVIVVGLILVYRLRRNARMSFAVAILVVLYGSPVVLVSNFVLLIAMMTPWRVPDLADQPSRPALVSPLRAISWRLPRH